MYYCLPAYTSSQYIPSLLIPSEIPPALPCLHRPHAQVGIDSCPASSVPYISIACKGPWCVNFMRPCLKAQTVTDCGIEGLVCRELFPGAPKTVGDQMLDWLSQWKCVPGCCLGAQKRL